MAPAVSRSCSAAIRRWRSDELLGDAREAVIEHQGEEYRLRRTRQGRLILNK